MHAAQRADAADTRDGARAAARGLHDLLGLDIEPVGERPAHRDAHHALARALDAVGRRRAPVVVDADDRGAVLLHAGDQPLLDRRVVRERAVAVEVVLADVDQDADRRIERRRKIDLIGRALDHVHASGARRLEREDRGADIAAELGVVAGARAADARSSAVVVDLPLVPVIATNGALRRVAAPLAAEQLDVADHLDRRPRAQARPTSAAPDA